MRKYSCEDVNYYMKSNFSSFLLVYLIELKMALLFASLALFFEFEVIYVGVSGEVMRDGVGTCFEKRW